MPALEDPAPKDPAAHTPSVDVIVNAYNYGRFVSDAIESALAQTRPFGRVIVVNDGSTDDTLARIAPFADRVVLVDKENGGQLSACFAGLAEATADYVWFLDADDYLLPTAVETLTPYLASQPVKVQFQLVGVDAERNPRDSLFPVYPETYGAREMIEDNQTLGYYISSPTSGNVYTRAFLEACDPALLDLRDSPDGTPNLIAPYMGEVLSVNVPIGFYRVHGNSFSQWGQPTVHVFESEIAMLARRWKEAEALLGGRAIAPDLESVLYTLERRLMIAALAAPAEVPEAARRFTAKLRASRISRPMRLGKLAWAHLLCLPSPALRERLIVARRSTTGRPRLVNKAILAAKRLYTALGTGPAHKSPPAA